MDITTRNLESRSIQWTNCATPTLQLQTRCDLKGHRQHQAQDTKSGATSRDTDNIRHKTQQNQGRPQEKQTTLGARHKTRGDLKRHRQHQAQHTKPGVTARDTDNIRHNTQNQGQPQETQTTLQLTKLCKTIVLCDDGSTQCIVSRSVCFLNFFIFLLLYIFVLVFFWLVPEPKICSYNTLGYTINRQ